MLHTSRMVVIRPARTEDAAFLQQMLVTAADWRPGTPRRTVMELMSDPSLNRYVDGWPQDRDFGVVAEADQPVGAAWCRFFSATDHGYGFIDETIPELSVAVQEAWRRRGIGERLLRALVAHAQAAGVPALSLSVEPDNSAAHLYERLGFEVVGRSGGALTMLLRLAAGAIAFPDPALAVGRVALRPWRDEDVTVLARWSGDDDIVRWTDVPAEYTESAAAQWLAQVERERLEGRGLGLAVVDAATNGVAGSIEVRLGADDRQVGELGYLVAEASRGRHVARTAVGLLAAWGFAALGLARWQALVHPDNAASQRVLVALGFRREGVLRGYRSVHGQREDRVMWSLLPGELTAFAPE